MLRREGEKRMSSRRARRSEGVNMWHSGAEAQGRPYLDAVVVEGPDGEARQVERIGIVAVARFRRRPGEGYSDASIRLARDCCCRLT